MLLFSIVVFSTISVVLVKAGLIAALIRYRGHVSGYVLWPFIGVLFASLLTSALEIYELQRLQTLSPWESTRAGPLLILKLKNLLLVFSLAYLYGVITARGRAASSGRSKRFPGSGFLGHMRRGTVGTLQRHTRRPERPSGPRRQWGR